LNLEFLNPLSNYQESETNKYRADRAGSWKETSPDGIACTLNPTEPEIQSSPGLFIFFFIQYAQVEVSAVCYQEALTASVLGS
jgi:hypothetical protein